MTSDSSVAKGLSSPANARSLGFVATVVIEVHRNQNVQAAFEIVSTHIPLGAQSIPVYGWSVSQAHLEVQNLNSSMLYFSFAKSGGETPSTF